MKIVIVNRDKIENIPPMISVIEILVELGHNVSVITTGITDKNKHDFEQKGVHVSVIPYEITKSIIKRVVYVQNYRKNLVKKLRNGNFDLVWIEGAGTFRTVLGIIEKYPFVMQISELYDYPEAEPVRKAIAKLIHQARVVVMPEPNRANFYKEQYKLDIVPSVLPNKPYFYLEGSEMASCESKYAEQLAVFKEKKVVLYQGIIAKERDLSNYIKAVKKLGDEYQFVLLGSDRGMLDVYKSIDPRIIHIDFIPAPEYLVFTSKAYIGILTYDPSTLNCAYCAPNKLYEYGRYGLPMIGNDIPGLKSTIGLYKAGVIVDETSVDSIAEGIKKVSHDYKTFSENARILYNSTDNKINVDKILNQATGKK